MNYKRSSGVILHPTSLPGPDGIGDLGPDAYRWVDFLTEMGCELWQVLPLSPTGYGDSPYQSFSAFAGNHYLISPTLLLEDRLLTRADLSDRPDFPADHVDFGPVIQWKVKLLNRAFERFRSGASPQLAQEFERFKQDVAFWLDDYAMFMSIKEANGMVSWDQWPEPLRTRQPEALKAFHKENPNAILNTQFRQFLFFRQWQALRAYARERQITIIGDIPIFVAYDSADAWSHRELFFIDPSGQPTVVAGVPPDYFSPTGQLWGNPIYRWTAHQASGYAWWIQRMRAILRLVDIIRLDHFRGFAGYWEVPAGMPTAEKGRWVQGPGFALFEALREALGDLPILAEDLGEISQDVIDLRVGLNLPGMKVFQFAFLTDSTDPFMPHNYTVNNAAYTGTHDNDTTRGWYENAPEAERDMCRRYLARSGDDIAWDAIRAVWGTVAVFALAPMQDLLSLPGSARMNFPGRPAGNWSWRMHPDAMNAALAARMKEMNFLYGRLAGTPDTPPTPKTIPYTRYE